VAKKSASSAPAPEKMSAPIEDVSPAANPAPEVETPAEYTPRKVQLPESGKLDLGTKFVSRPAVVFHNRPAPSQNSSGASRPSFPGPNRPRFSSNNSGSPSSSGGF